MTPVEDKSGLCILCGSAESRVLFEKNSYPIIKCGGCGLESLGKPPGREILDSLYSKSYFKGMTGEHGYGYADYEKERRELQLNFRERMKHITSRAAGGRLLDVGCAMGFFLETLGPEWEKEGVDVSDYAAGFAKEKLGLNVRAGSFLELDFPENHYDVITMWDAIEHIEAPLEALRKANRLLKPGGMILLVTGDTGSAFARLCGRRWRLYNPPQHIFYFSRSTLTGLLEKAGFTPLETAACGRVVSGEYLVFVAKALAWTSPLKFSLPLIRAAARLKKTFRFNFGDLMLMTAEKK